MAEGLDRWRIYSELSAAALVFVVAILLGLLGGQWLDRILGTTPLLALSLMALGLIGAVINLLRTLKKIENSK
jgi:F0F1-type ATP synthase assembly protein I